MDALLIIDVQNDFMPGGALPVPRGDEILPLVNALSRRFELVVATQDWHPPDHGSFASSHPGKRPGDRIVLHGLPQGLWPPHCVQHTAGAALHADLDTSRVARVVRKGTDPAIDSYSGFWDNGRRRSTGLAEVLRQAGVDTVWIAGLATDYCVLWTALDARREGFLTRVLTDACRGIDLEPGDVTRALEQMRAAGVRLVGSHELLAHDHGVAAP
jgi:nicotinamidase/pyrazinamidase